MDIDEESKRLYVGTSGKRIAVYDIDSQEKVCEKELAHGKGIYGLCAVPTDEASILTCSADNLIKRWRLDEESKDIVEVDFGQPQVDETVEGQLLNTVCFTENDTLYTVSINL